MPPISRFSTQRMVLDGDQMNTETETDTDTPAEPEQRNRLQADIGHTGSKQNGNEAEAWVQDTYSLDGQHPEDFPAYAHDVWDGRNDTPGEVKSAQIRYSGNGKRGRFQIWDYAHQRLLDAGGFYVFVVHEPRSDRFHPYLHRPLPATAVEELITTWYPIDHDRRPDEAMRASLAQSAVFSDIQVDRIDPEEQDSGTDVDADTAPGRTPQAVTVKQLKQIISDIEAQNSDGVAPKPLVLGKATDAGIDMDAAQHQIDELRTRGDIYEPEEGAYRVV